MIKQGALYQPALTDATTESLFACVYSWLDRGRVTALDLHASEAVIQEAAAGHPEPAARRLAAAGSSEPRALDSRSHGACSIAT